MNLLDQFVLQHVQVSLLKAKLIHLSSDAASQEQEARVELNLAPRLLNSDDQNPMPAYQVSARLSCKGGSSDESGARFVAQVGYEVIYQQMEGDPMDLSEFTANHASLTRQIYPLLQQEMRTLLIRMGLEQVHLPFDLAAKVSPEAEQTVQVSGAVH